MTRHVLEVLYIVNGGATELDVREFLQRHSSFAFVTERHPERRILAAGSPHRARGGREPGKPLRMSAGRTNPFRVHPLDFACPLRRMVHLIHPDLDVPIRTGQPVTR